MFPSKGDDYLREANNRGTAIIRGNTVCSFSMYKENISKRLCTWKNSCRKKPLLARKKPLLAGKKASRKNACTSGISRYHFNEGQMIRENMRESV